MSRDSNAPMFLGSLSLTGISVDVNYRKSNVIVEDALINFQLVRKRAGKGKMHVVFSLFTATIVAGSSTIPENILYFFRHSQGIMSNELLF